MDEAIFPRSSEQGVSRRRSKALIVLMLFLVILGGVLFAGSILLGSSSDEEIQSETDVAPTAIIEPTEILEPADSDKTKEKEKKDTQTVTPKPTVDSNADSVDKATGLDRSLLRIEVLNGSGVSGAASKMAEMLRGLGYKVASVGNADSFNYSGVTIQLRKTKSDFAALLKKDLSKSYAVSETTTDLAEEGKDAVIIVGS